VKERLSFLFSYSQDVPLGRFAVAKLKPFTDLDKPIPEEQIEPVFLGKNENADLLMGFGIARQVSQDTGNVLILFNHSQEVIFPNNMDYEQGKHQG